MDGYKVMLTTLCYIRSEDGERYLMLRRDKKAHDLNEGKWIGVGGKLEPGESPTECLLREVREETGLTLTEWEFKGIITFINDRWGDEYMLLYEGTRFEGELTDCSEGTLEWIERGRILDLPLWEGDRAFLTPMLEGQPSIHVKLIYEDDRLVQVLPG